MLSGYFLFILGFALPRAMFNTDIVWITIALPMPTVNLSFTQPIIAILLGNTQTDVLMFIHIYRKIKAV